MYCTPTHLRQPRPANHNKVATKPKREMNVKSPLQAGALFQTGTIRDTYQCIQAHHFLSQKRRTCQQCGVNPPHFINIYST